MNPIKYLIDIAKEAMEEVGITPEVSPIRGGTDGARLSYIWAFRVPTSAQEVTISMANSEFIPVQSMEKVVELLLTIVRKFEKIEK